jgi:hypothetical protein
LPSKREQENRYENKQYNLKELRSAYKLIKNIQKEHTNKEFIKNNLLKGLNDIIADEIADKIIRLAYTFDIDFE